MAKIIMPITKSENHQEEGKQEARRLRLANEL